MIRKDHWFTDEHSFRCIDTRRIIYFLVCLSSFFITETGRFLYRPFIYENNINDFGLADSIGNLGGIVAQIYLGLAIFNSPKSKGWRIVLFMTIGYIIYEFLQPYLPKGVFDWKDIWGTIIGGLISGMVYIAIHRSDVTNKVYKRF